jgi:3-hydroxyacyl-CoA dehydrogenase
LLLIDNPPVNVISSAVVAGLLDALDRFEQDREARALVITCAGRTFVAGGNIVEFDDPAFSAKPYNGVLVRIEAQSRPVVAALHGTTLGGGMELALAAHYRVAKGGSQFGFPEVKLGILPGSLGTQRLPRLAGPELALDLISSGRSIGTADALKAGILDPVFEGDPVNEGIAFARTLVARTAPVRPTHDRTVAFSEAASKVFRQALEHADARALSPCGPRHRQGIAGSAGLDAGVRAGRGPGGSAV